MNNPSKMDMAMPDPVKEKERSHFLPGRSRVERLLMLGCIVLTIIILAVLISLIIVVHDRNDMQKRMVDALTGLSSTDADQEVSSHTTRRSWTSKASDGWSSSTPTTGAEEICSSSGCVKAAAGILDNMHEHVPPCHDFYEFACGGWADRHVIPEDLTSYSTFTMLGEELLVQLKSILEHFPAPDNDVFAFSKTTEWVKRVYDACMNLDYIEHLGMSPVNTIISTLGNWTLGKPVSPEPQQDWLLMMARMRALDLNRLFSFYVGADAYNTTRRLIHIDQPGLSLPSREYFFPAKHQIPNCSNETLAMGRDPRDCKPMDDPADTRTDLEIFWDDRYVQALFKYWFDIASKFGVENETLAEQQIHRMIEFERRIAMATVPMSERRNKTAMYNPMTVQQLIDRYTNIDWARYLDEVFWMLKEEGKAPDRDTIIIVSQPDYLDRLNVLLEGVKDDAEYQKMLIDYSLLYVVRNVAPLLGEEVQEIRLKFAAALYGVKTKEARWKKCVGLSNGLLPFALGKLYVDAYFDGSAKDTALEMIEGIRNVFDDVLNEVNWLDKETRSLTRDKANSIRQYIGYPDFINNPQQLDEEYKNLNMTTNMTSHAENMFDFWRWSGAWDLSRLYEPVNKTKNSLNPAVVNAYYHQMKNAISFPAGILQSPFFAKDVPRYLNYGGVGSVIGHELTHGFDDEGRQVDKEGNIAQWWSDNVIHNFVDKAKCMVDQYSEYTIYAMGRKWQVNGTNTQGENIADNGGLKQAFRAYKKYLSQHGTEPRLPGLENYSPEQLFFINFANVWCSTMREEAVVAKVRTSVHSPGRFRVMGTLSNSQEFSQVFNCPVGSPMNPEKKCEVW